MNDSTTERLHHTLVDRISPVMFALSLIFLAMISTLIVLWVDVPRVARGNADSAGGTSSAVEPDDSLVSLAGMAIVSSCCLLWPVFWADFVITRLACRPEHRRWRDGLVACLIPPLRLGGRNPEMESRIWLPAWSWCEVDDDLRKRLRKGFGGPMIVIALMILPVLLVEFSMQSRINENLWLRGLLHVGTGVIWFAFAFEFILMYSVAEKKLAYCKDHWIDLVIILLPLVSFLRSIRAIRAMRLAKLAKAHQLSRMGRIYRLRGLAVKAFRALLLFEVVYRITGITPQKRLERLELTLAEKEDELEDLREQVETLKKVVARQKKAEEEAEENAAEKEKTEPEAAEAE
jgi:voltage-gated potassium channel